MFINRGAVQIRGQVLLYQPPRKNKPGAGYILILKCSLRSRALYNSQNLTSKIQSQENLLRSSMLAVPPSSWPRAGCNMISTLARSMITECCDKHQSLVKPVYLWSKNDVMLQEPEKCAFLRISAFQSIPILSLKSKLENKWVPCHGKQLMVLCLYRKIKKKMPRLIDLFCSGKCNVRLTHIAKNHHYFCKVIL